MLQDDTHLKFPNRYLYEAFWQRWRDLDRIVAQARFRSDEQIQAYTQAQEMLRRLPARLHSMRQRPSMIRRKKGAR